MGSSPTARAKTKNMSQLTTYIKESYNELVQKVTWPSWSSLQESSILVFVASLIIAGVVFAMDVAFGINKAGNVFLIIKNWPGVIGAIYDPSTLTNIQFADWFLDHWKKVTFSVIALSTIGVVVYRKKVSKN